MSVINKFKLVNFFNIKIFILIILIPIVFLSGLYFGIKLYREHGVNSFENFICNLDKYAGRYLNSTPKSADMLEISISDQEHQKLKAYRNDAVKMGVVLKKHKKYIKAKIKYKNHTYDAELRLKGDNVDHLEGDKWSYRVKIGNGETVGGLRKFSLQTPKSRNFTYEWLYHKILKKEDIIALRYNFVNLKVNNQDVGIYALEEHFDKLLIENNKRREGPILKFNEDQYWEGFFNPFNQSNHIDYDKESFNTANIEVFQENKTLKNKHLYDQFNIANSLLYNFKSGKLNTNEVFDVKKLATFFSLNDLLGAHHANRWHNLRFYYNPISSKLEPIGFDANCGGEINHLNIENEDPFCNLIFKDSTFVKEYYNELIRISDCDFMDNLFESFGKEFVENCKILNEEFFYYEFHNLTQILKNQAFIKKEINQKNKITAHLISINDKKIMFEIINKSHFPIQIDNVMYKKNKLMKSPEFIPMNDEGFTSILLTTELINPIDTIKANKFKVLYHIIGSNDISKTKAYAYPKEKKEFVTNNFMTSKTDLAKFPYLNIDEVNNIITFNSGEHLVNKTIIFPAGYQVVGKSNTSLIFTDSAQIISYSPFHIEGNENSKFKIIGADSTAKGLCILQSEIESTFNHVVFRNLSNPSKNNWSLSGAVNFFGTTVNLSNCSFFDLNCEDALNIINSSFSIENCEFNGVFSDAFDSDFSTGSIINCKFSNVGNDGIDVSGTSILINNISFNNINDKAISIGENSRATAKKINISNSNFGFVSKDLSELKIVESVIDNVNIGFLAFQKKPEFGPAKIVAERISISNTIKPFSIEQKSIFIMNGEKKKSLDKDIKRFIYN